MYVAPGTSSGLGNVRWVSKYARPDSKRLGVVFVLWLFEKCLIMILPIISGMLVQQVIVQGHRHKLWVFLAIMVSVPVVRGVVRYVYQVESERFGQNTIFRLVSDEYEKLHTLDFAYFNHTRTGDIMNRMTSDTDAIRHTVSWVTYQVADAFAMVTGALCVMFVIDWRLASALLVITPGLYYFARKLSTHTRPLFYSIRNSLSEMNSLVEENIEGNRVVKAFVREDFETEKFDRQSQEYFDKNMSLAENSRRYLPWLDAGNWALQVITLFLGGFLVMRGYMNLGNLVTFSSFLWMLSNPLGQSGNLIMDIQRFNASCTKIRMLLDSESRITEKPDAHESVAIATTIARKVQESQGDAGVVAPETIEARNQAKLPEKISGEISFNHVSFSFPDDPETPILKNIDFHIPTGSKLGILGETGSGKSTLVSLISRFYDPSIGNVLVDGIDARDWPLETLRSQVLVVAQDTFLFSDTIGDNIAFGADKYDPDYIQRMAHIAGVDDFIRSLPEGYGTIVGERGVGLSGGQKQRLSLARALADNPSILIMDDTTSAVDMETEAEIQRNLRAMEGSKTIITIAHRISSVRDSDVIIVLEHGQIIEQGTHQQLVEAHGRYYSIYRKQLGLESGQAMGFED